MKYRKKPVIVEAMQYNGDNSIEIFHFCNKAYFEHMSQSLIVNTLEGKMHVD